MKLVSVIVKPFKLEVVTGEKGPDAL